MYNTLCLLLTNKDVQSTQSNDFVNNEMKYKTVIIDTIICTWTHVLCIQTIYMYVYIIVVY